MAAAEVIPDQDNVHRAFFDDGSQLGLDDHAHMPFQQDRATGRRAESVFWSRYVQNDADLHGRGHSLEAAKNARRHQQATQLLKYIGFRTANVGIVRAIPVSDFGGCFDVEHKPNVDQAHSEIVMEEPRGKLPKNDRRALISDLFKVFSKLNEPEDQTPPVYTPPMM